MELRDRKDADRAEESAPDAAPASSSQRWSMPMARELTARDLDEQRRLVRASLLATAA
jgi:hypothetical protein